MRRQKAFHCAQYSSSQPLMWVALGSIQLGIGCAYLLSDEKPDNTPPPATLPAQEPGPASQPSGAATPAAKGTPPTATSAPVPASSGVAVTTPAAAAPAEIPVPPSLNIVYFGQGSADITVDARVTLKPIAE